VPVLDLLPVLRDRKQDKIVFSKNRQDAFSTPTNFKNKNKKILSLVVGYSG
jgi:hypothetical protein